MSRHGLVLCVGNLPSNRLALTNKIYISPDNLSSLLAARGPEHNTSNPPLVTVGPHPYACEAHPNVPNDQIAMNGLHRRFAQLSLATKVEVKPFVPPPNFALATLELTVDLLAKRSAGRGPPRELDTERLASDVLLSYEGQIFEVGRVVAMDFEGTKLEITVKDLGQMDVGGKGSGGGRYDSMGQLLGPTDITFEKAKGSTAIALTGSKVSGGGGGASNIFLKDFDFEKLGIGGLDSEFNEIFRRAFASRIWPAHIIKQMGINHVRGMLLYGPPGCGKTLIARQIGKVLNAREPKIVNGPEILDKYVGGSEEKVRELFAEAEKEQLEAGDHSMLHIIILDEMDAICKSRGTVRDGTGVSDSVVNQLLSKIDGVDSLNNILLIGMTNRKDMIDDALLRPGRLEVHVEIGLPDTKGRMQILGIHTNNMREANRLQPEVIKRLDEIAERTKNFSGAEIEGLVKAATSFALTRCVDVKDLSKAPDEKNLILRFDDFDRALNDVQPKFGAKSQELKALYRNGFVPYGDEFDMLMGTMDRLVEQVRASEKTPLMSVLLHGPPASGKTAVTAKVAVSSGYPFVRMISADEMIGYSEMSKCQTIHKVFLDSYKSPLSLIFIDDIERIIDYVPIGPRFSNTVLQTLLVLLKKVPPDNGRKLLIIGTTSCPHLLEDLGLVQAFSVQQAVPLLEEPSQIEEVLRVAAHLSEHDAESISKAITKPIGIKTLLMVAEMAQQGSPKGQVDVNIFLECLHTVGY
uniref:Vesicle-fusing ATPase n=1 Tax=Helicotheca tamesis TaxID=374047 RepID=A0A7S2MX11_9STRA|mmetsp:Transcript_4909/g.6749  ORF Transcript_4909/g.6749 Transcript_4909/m.6749 type:complete len:749 (+) Transcript_4909:97-2343(+)|eukprot:CAMPEP_0185723942 /NCGR_PEP_ID=MMETSP1171-20130828/599_1 /TAXON_ID=374046 /ORGANISM="Helicotheca tamensis, Strain CCMP826" /LENGTH=748 /DNA_ID=CAMNT_0028391713 /DNA_START=26 /DNA_END=2272 /DNA_ORIENTATION=+